MKLLGLIALIYNEHSISDTHERGNIQIKILTIKFHTNLCRETIPLDKK